MNKYFLVLVSFVSLILACNTKGDDILPAKPNIIYILADDLGYGDLSCYGQEKFITPNIDALAKSGMRFTHHYSGSTVCAPSRAVLMTGLHTGHVSVRGNKEHVPEGQEPMAASEETIAAMLKKEGYVTGAFGKWGLGYPGSVGDPMNKGFDEFYGYNCQRLAHHYYPRHLWKNDTKVMLPQNEGKKKGQYAPDLIQKETIAFLENNKDKPFFLYVPHVIPHAELVAPDSIMEKYRGKYLPEKVYVGTDDGEKYREGPYESQDECHAAFVAMIEVFDNHVGEIVQKVKELGIEENTLIIVTSDNGPHGEGGADPAYFNSAGPFSGIKRSLKDGGVRVPMIASWKGKVPEGAVSDHLSSFQDVKATIAEITGIENRAPDDGISFLPSLTGVGEQEEHEFLYWEFNEQGQKLGVRYGKYKAIIENLQAGNTKFELYDLSISPAENVDIADEHPEIINEIKAIIRREHVLNENFILLIDQEEGKGILDVVDNP